MTLQEAIDNAPSWAQWLVVDGNGVSGAYFEIKSIPLCEMLLADYPKVEDFCLTTPADGPKLIEVNK